MKRQTIGQIKARISNNKISDGAISLNRITDPKLRGVDCKAARATLKMIDEYPEDRYRFKKQR